MLYKALSGSVMTYAWKYVADAHLLKLQHLQNRVLCATGNIYRCTPVLELHVTSKIPYMTTHINHAGHKQKYS
jgi:hypothetical protein